MTTSQTQFFEAIPASVGRAREFTDRVLAGWKHTSRTDDIRLCASELASNAVVHGSTRDHGFLVAIGLADGVVSLEVHDSRRERPTACFPVEYDTAGRGLVLVAALSDEWGVRDREPLGKVVWSRFEIAPGVKSGAAALLRCARSAQPAVSSQGEARPTGEAVADQGLVCGVYVVGDMLLDGEAEPWAVDRAASTGRERWCIRW